jgi:hypothetical protein
VSAGTAGASKEENQTGKASMAQIFSRNSNALARMSLALTVLAALAVGLALDQLQRAPWVTRQGERPDQPVPFSHKHHVQTLGLQCQYCHTTAESSSYAGIPPTRTCMNCHGQIWPNAEVLEPVRRSWQSGESIRWTKVHDLPDYVYFSHEIHVRKGVSCAACHGRVDQMTQMYAQNTLQMEWCLDCHRDPAKNLRPTGEVYNMAWTPPSAERPVWCAAGVEKPGAPTAERVKCVTKEPEGAQKYQKFTTQDEMGRFLADEYKIRTPKELTSCEVCHR